MEIALAALAFAATATQMLLSMYDVGRAGVRGWRAVAHLLSWTALMVVALSVMLDQIADQV